MSSASTSTMGASNASSPSPPRPPKQRRVVPTRLRATSPAALAARSAFLAVLVVSVAAILTTTTPASAYVVRRRSLLQEQANSDDYLSPIISSLPPETTEALSSYLGNAELVSRMRDVASRRCTHLGARVYEIGRSVRGQPIVAMSIGHDSGRRSGAAAEALAREEEEEAKRREASGRAGDNARGLLRAFAKPAADESRHEGAKEPRSRRRKHRAHVKYVAGLHGDEPSGRQMLLALAEYVCAFDPRLAAEELRRRRGGEAAGTTSPAPSRRRHADPRVAALLSRSVLHVLPSANPDGFDLRRRENANGVDLNRDFPDPLESRGGVPVGGAWPASNSSSEATAAASTAATAPDFFVGSLPGRSPDPDADDVDLSPRGKEQPETLALMRWMTPTSAEGPSPEPNRFRFVASAALHEGALVANYPWDGTPDGGTRYAACPDDATFRHLATSYARRSPAMVSGPEFGRGVARPTDDGLVVPSENGAGSSSSSASVNGNATQPLPDVGTTNGAAWYPLRGGMQDWNYLSASCFELTLELSQSKWPRPALLPRMFAENLDPLLAYPVVATSGARGVVASAAGADERERTGSTSAASAPPPPGATVRVRGLRGAPPALPDPATGAWFRPLSPGRYVLSVAAPGLQPVEAEVDVGRGAATKGADADGKTSSSPWGGGIPASSPEVEVTLRERGSTARLVDPSDGERADGAAEAFSASAVPVPLRKEAAATRPSSLAGDVSAFLLQAALAGGALAALVAVLRAKSSSSQSASSTPVPSPATKARTSSSSSSTV